MDWYKLALSFYDIPREMKGEPRNLGLFLDELKNLFIKKVECLDDKLINEFKRRKGDPEIKSKSELVIKLAEEISRFNILLRSSMPYTISTEKKIRDYFFRENGKCRHKHDFVTTIDPEHNMYRMRGADNYINYSSGEMYLHNSDLYNMVGAARFNHSGQACLYTADSLYTAWEELRRPDFHKTNFVRINTTKRLEVLDLTIPPLPNSFFLLIRAYICLVVSSKTDDSDRHHWQYVFPQLLIKILSEVIREHSSDIFGIKYLSSRRFECEDYNIDNTPISSAYVFPSRLIGDHGYCEKLAKCLKMTEPLSYFFLKLHRQKFTPVDKPFVSDYQCTIFAELEEVLKKRPLVSCLEIITR